MKFADTPKITVAIRKRPLNKKELQRSQSDIVRVGMNGQVTVSEHKQKVDLTKYLQETTFNFDFAFDQTSTNQQIYEQSIRPLIDNAFMGAKISCFAYGQTGSGKTHTMKGDISKNIPGLYFLGARQIFNFLEQSQFRHLHVTVSFYEIYCGRLYDLLNSRTELKIREDNKQNINVIGLVEKSICGANEFLDVIEYGSNFRVTSQNATNSESSRSHAILQISLKHEKKVFTKISFIDLAGNQRGADHIDQNKQTKIDGAEINKSLLSLKECIRALDQGKGHTPFRGSKLTMVLRDSFVGFCNTVMICNVSPNSLSSENTMNTLRYADRVKELKSSSGENLSKEEMLSRQLMLPRANNKNCIKVNIDNNDDEEDIMIRVQEARQGGTQVIKNNYDYEEKMDIEQPYENRKIFIGNGRKTENFSHEMNIFNMGQKRGQGSNDPRLNRPDSTANVFKGRVLAHEGEKQPLHSQNVRKNQVDQNNLNFGNTQQYEVTKRHFVKPNRNPNSNSLEPTRSQFEQMRIFDSNLEHYCDDQMNLAQAQKEILNLQANILDECNRITSLSLNSNQQKIEETYAVLDRTQQVMRQKKDIIDRMLNNIAKIRASTKMTQAQLRKIRKDQQDLAQRQGNPFFINESSNSLSQNVNLGKNQARFHAHSNMNGSLHFNGFGNNHHHQYGDEQLLEGLPGDQTMTRLF